MRWVGRRCAVEFDSYFVIYQLSVGHDISRFMLGARGNDGDGVCLRDRDARPVEKRLKCLSNKVSQCQCEDGCQRVRLLISAVKVKHHKPSACSYMIEVETYTDVIRALHTCSFHLWLRIASEPQKMHLSVFPSTQHPTSTCHISEPRHRRHFCTAF